MLNEYLFLTPTPAAHEAHEENNAPHMSIQVGALGEDAVFLVLHTESPLLPGDALITYRAADDAVATIIDQALFEQIRPFGNNSDGTATGMLLYTHLAGFPTRLFDNGEVYPAGSQPFDAECRHKYFDTPATPSSTGWGFRYELIGKAETRDPSARAIGVYSDHECTQYLWTTGALQLGNSDWQTDDLGNPIEVWYTDSWDGDRPDDQKDWHIALLLGSAQEGHQTLPAGSQGIHYLFWEFDQGYEPPPVGQWVDTGATIIAQAGTVYRISDAAVAAALIPGQAIRLGDTAETTFTGVWAGGADYIEIDPFVQASVGDIVWAWQ